MSDESPSATGASDREIVLTRVLNAPRELVFRAWSSPEHLARWWGPDGFTTTTYEMQFEPGGVWRYMMHGPDGTDYPNKVAYREIVEPEKIIYDHSDDGTGPIHFQVTATFASEGTQTRLTMRLVFPTAEARDYVVREYGAIEGGRQTLARLAAYVEQK